MIRLAKTFRTAAPFCISDLAETVKNMKQNAIKYLIVLFGILAAFDIVFLILSNDYRNLFGVIRNISDVIWRSLSDAIMIILYWLAYLKLKRDNLQHHLIVLHGFIYSLLGIFMCIPWGGYFIAPLTPMALPYLGSILYFGQPGYYISLGIATIFVVGNVYLIRYGLAKRK